MKKIFSVMMLVLSLFLISCSSKTNETSQKALADGKVALASQEYEKANNLFKLAYNEDNKNTEAKSYLDLSDNYIKFIALIDKGDYDKTDDIIAQIEKSDKLSSISSDFEKKKKMVTEYKDKVKGYTSDVEKCEKLFKDGDIDNAKSQAEQKLKEVKDIKTLTDRLNSVINNVNQTIEKAKAEILKCEPTDYGLSYEGLKSSDHNGYSIVESLKGKKLLNFVEDQNYGSPSDYMYDMSDGNIYRVNQGNLYWVNNNNKIIYEDSNNRQEQAESDKTQSSSSASQSTASVSKVNVSAEQARKIALDYFLKAHPGAEEKDYEVAKSTEIDENNEYYRGVCINSGSFKVVAEYYVNASTGKLRVLWD